jgi:DnaK suppressor protein
MGVAQRLPLCSREDGAETNSLHRRATDFLDTPPCSPFRMPVHVSWSLIADRFNACHERQEGSCIMATTRRIKDWAKRTRRDDIRRILEDRHSSLAQDVHGRIRDTRTDSVAGREVLDEGESSEIDIQGDIEFALIQMKAETLNNIDTALHRIGEGNYGYCFECGGEITEARLRALPFAVRCRDCEEVREAIDHRERSSVQRRDLSALLVDLYS